MKFLDPKLEKYRERRKAAETPYIPKTLEDFIGVIQRTPRSVLGMSDRERIAAVMSFEEKTDFEKNFLA